MTKCNFCGGEYSAVYNGVVHAENCLTNQEGQKAREPDNIRSLGAARFDKNIHPAKLSPRAALERAMQFFDECDEKPNHIIVIVGRNYGDQGCSETKFYQAGDYRHHSQMGLLVECSHLIRESSTE